MKNSHKKTECRSAAMLLWLFFAATGNAQISSNMEKLDAFFQKAVDSLFTRVAAGDSVFLLQSLDEENNLNWLFEKSAFAALSLRKYRISAVKDSDIRHAVLYYLPSSEIEYTRLTKRKISRHIKSELYLKLVSSAGDVQFSDRLSIVETDTIPSPVSCVENRAYPFTVGNMKPSTHLQWLEFFAAATATLAVALLFYFYRSH